MENIAKTIHQAWYCFQYEKLIIRVIDFVKIKIIYTKEQIWDLKTASLVSTWGLTLKIELENKFLWPSRTFHLNKPNYVVTNSTKTKLI